VTADGLAILVLVFAVPMLGLVLWNVVAWPAVTTSSGAGPEAVSVLIPARDEAGTIEACLASVLSQGPGLHEALVYDDRSTDDTAVRVERLAAGDSRVRLLHGGDLPPGWCGKPHACARLAEAAAGKWLLFLDADARLWPEALSRLVQDAQSRRLTLLSAWPGLVLVSAWERLLMPVLNLVVFSLYPAPLSLLRNDPSLGLAHGACILVHRATYLKLGGHGLVRDQLFEDSRLAQAWRAGGERGLCLDGQSIVTVRMYSTGTEIWRGFQKNFYPAFRRDVSFWGFLAMHALVFVLPVILFAAAPSTLTAAAAAAGIMMRVLLALRFRHPLWSAVLQPVAATVMLGIARASRTRYRAAAGVEWKGRHYTARGEVPRRG
jgi:glycosyltransferase involved in cell wall biosynthesis